MTKYPCPRSPIKRLMKQNTTKNVSDKAVTEMVFCISEIVAEITKKSDESGSCKKTIMDRDIRPAFKKWHNAQLSDVLGEVTDDIKRVADKLSHMETVLRY